MHIHVANFARQRLKFGCLFGFFRAIMAFQVYLEGLEKLVGLVPKVRVHISAVGYNDMHRMMI